MTVSFSKGSEAEETIGMTRAIRDPEWVASKSSGQVVSGSWRRVRGLLKFHRFAQPDRCIAKSERCPLSGVNLKPEQRLPPGFLAGGDELDRPR